MNKKFLKVSLIICIPFVLIIGFFSMTATNTEEEWPVSEELEIEYKGYTEDKYDYIVSIVVKNNTRNIASINDVSLSFNYKSDYRDNGGRWSSDEGVYFKGYDEYRFSEESVLGIDPGTDREIMFNIPKAINLDKEVFNIEQPVVDYNISFYKYRTSKSSLMFGYGMSGGSKTLGMNR